MAKPMVAIVGRPNVGKSMLFNKLAGKRLSIVEDTPGVTRDRLYADCDWNGREFTIVDTGGIEPRNDNEILQFMRGQAEIAIDNADVIVLVCDIRTGVTAADQDVANMLLRSKKPVVLAVNKADRVGPIDPDVYEFYNLGLGDPIAISAIHGLGVDEMLDACFEYFPDDVEEEEQEDVIKVAVIGKPNVGKSSLLNRLTDAGVLVEDALFATLDPTVRRARAADGREYTLTDTVGFVRNLPTQLVEAFRSTLEEVGQADVILHVVDAAHPDPVSQVQAVRAVIDTIEGASDIPELIALNKADLASPEQIALLRTVFPGAVPLSAHTGWGVEALRAALEDMLPRPRVAIDAIVPYSAGSLVHRIHEEGEVEREEYVETGTRIVARVDEALAAIIAREAVGGTADDEPVSAS